MLDAQGLPNHSKGILDGVEARLLELDLTRGSVRGFVVDNWQNDKNGRRLVSELQKAFALPVIVLNGVEDCRDIAEALDGEASEALEVVFLWALSRSRIRELVSLYIKDAPHLDDEAVTKKVLDDIDALNIHRTPLNCLLILKLLEQAFDDSPVNRTEMIGRVLYLLFFEFNEIPRYASRPDLKDCEYALGYICEGLIRKGESAFTRSEFFIRVSEYCRIHLIDFDTDVLFAFLVSENILVRKGVYFQFRFRYWLYYFAAHRMHHSPEFATFMLSDGRYASSPEVIEFYTGIDRRRSDAVTQLTADLRRMNDEFRERTEIPEAFDPYAAAKWNPDDSTIEKMEAAVSKGAAESALPQSVKDAIADEHYSRAMPYRQDLAQFIRESSLHQLVQTMKGGARALRNSDHVDPKAKVELLSEIMKCWISVCQVLAIISPVLAEHGSAAVEGMGFSLSTRISSLSTTKEKWEVIMSVISENVVTWFQNDLFSKRMGPMLAGYSKDSKSGMGRLLGLLVLIRQRPPGWEKAVEEFIANAHKNDFFLSRVCNGLVNEFMTGFANERSRQQLRKLAAMTLAKHQLANKPTAQDIEFKAKVLDVQAANAARSKAEGTSGGAAPTEGPAQK